MYSFEDGSHEELPQGVPVLEGAFYPYRTSLAHELGRCRQALQMSQLRMSKLLKIKLHRLSDLEKARSFPTPLEEVRIRRLLRELQQQTARVFGSWAQQNSA